MSYAEILEEIPRLSPEQLREVAKRVSEVETSVTSDSANSGFRLEEIDGKCVLVSPRVITQEEVEALLEDFP